MAVVNGHLAGASGKTWENSMSKVIEFLPIIFELISIEYKSY